MSAETRSMEQAESYARAERDRRYPVKRMLRETEEQEAQEQTLRKGKNITVWEAAERWYNAQKVKTRQTSVSDGRARCPIQSRA